MENFKDDRTKNELFLKLADASLRGDKSKIELVCLTMARTNRLTDSDFSKKLENLLLRESKHSVQRSAESKTAPFDSEIGLSLLKIDQIRDAKRPILTEELDELINQFLCEQEKKTDLFKEGLFPTRSLLFKGAPGTGKTMLAKWLSFKLGLPLATLDLATSISSYLGKTGENIRKVLDYARNTKCVLLLDEFDAIAKRRDDVSELGELKRIVNVLLKELEEWPATSILVAATNHPDLLDPAIDRRFDIALNFPNPSLESICILVRDILNDDIDDGFVRVLSNLLIGKSPSNITIMLQCALRRRVITTDNLINCIIFEMRHRFPEILGKSDSHLIKYLKVYAGMTVREISKLIGKSSTAVQSQIKKVSK